MARRPISLAGEIGGSPIEIIQRVVAIANGRARSAWQERAIKWSNEDKWMIPGAVISTVRQNEVDARYEVSILKSHERGHAMSMLLAAANGKSTLISFLHDLSGKYSRTVELRPIWRTNPVGNQIAITWHVIEHRFNGVIGMINFAGALLARDALGEQTAIGLCQLPSCRHKFFVIEAGSVGRQRTKYCCESHRLRLHASQAGERMRRSRAARRAAKNMPRHSRPK